jgi:hypothetical protein
MSAPPSAHDRHCHADPDCPRTPRFQAQLHRAHQEHQPPGQSAAARTLDTCADHLGDTVQALASWASATGFGSALVQFSVVGTLASEDDRRLPEFPFAVIYLPG